MNLKKHPPVLVHALLIFLFIFLFSINLVSAAPEDFISYWNTSANSTGSSDSSSITLPITGTYTVNWGDGTSNDSVASHTYSAPGVYTIIINDSAITGFRFNNVGDKCRCMHNLDARIKLLNSKNLFLAWKKERLCFI